MVKIKHKTKKILALITLFLVLFGIIQPTVMAANDVISGTGNDKFMARQYATRIKTTDAVNGGENGIVARRLIMRNQGWNFSNR